MATDGRLLHGILNVTIDQTDKLPSDWKLILYGQQATNEGILRIAQNIVKQAARTLVCAENVKVGSQRYATVDLDKARVARTRTIDGKIPQWGESFRVYCAHQIKNIVFTVKKNDPVGAMLIGRAYLPVEGLYDGQLVERMVNIVDEVGNPIPGEPKIHVKVQYTSVERDQDSHWAKGIGNSRFGGVPYTYFHQKGSCKLTLYQDAHVSDSFHNVRIPLDGGKYYEPHACWEDVFDAISNAQHFIYMTGWSFYTNITLIRNPRRPSATFGELLKEKAKSVKVLMLVWDDESSLDVKILGKDLPGIMGTHDQETADYFKDTGVQCVLCPRNVITKNSKKLSFMQRLQSTTMFTHHQKSVIVDSPDPQGGSQFRRIVSFVGGIDLCDGRYDTQDHPLFSTLSSTHHDDFHQPNFQGASIKKGGPREPWHDIHCKIEGPAAWDVLTNFEQRWKQQSGKPEMLIPRNKLGEFIVKESTPAPLSDQTEAWNIQIFRSIDRAAAADFPETPDQAHRAGLVSGKNNIFDRSIQDAYINAIRRAKNFIYLENQYFIGSSYDWKSNDIKNEDIGALNLIPKELSLKIVSKINVGERFSVYIVIPMWPEGVPETKSVQAILNWQKRTMEMMYTDITKALQQKGLDTDPREYLTFFCLGNREMKKGGEYQPTEKPEPNSDYSKAQQDRRFMIYVHSKMMIVDDEYIIIGSANINQRSMDGTRDTEIAMGAFQPYHLATSQQGARGQIYGFRMALWLEHLGMLEAAFQDPESLECIRSVNNLAAESWQAYSSGNLDRDLPRHLLRYPMDVASTGMVQYLPNLKFFPDTEAHILGEKAVDYPFPLLTT